MRVKAILVSALLVALLMLGNTISQAKGQTATFNLQFMTVPQKLIQDTDASLLIYSVDSTSNPLPIRISAVSVTSSDSSVVAIKKVSSSEVDNSVRVDIRAGKIGIATITAAANGFLSSTTVLEVVGDAYKPEGLLVKALPSSFSHLGPYRGYVSVQLINYFGNPVPADQDITIKLTSTDSSVVDLEKEVVITRGENSIINEFNVRSPGITLLQAEVAGKWKEEVKISVSQPKAPLELKFYAGPQIAPAQQGQFVYGFIQLQDATGVPVKAEKDISVTIFSDSSDIRTAPAIIKKGTTTAMARLTIMTNTACLATNDRAPLNTKFTPCIELVATAKGFKSQSALIELRTPVTRVQLNPETRFDDPNYVKIDPVMWPTSIITTADQLSIDPTISMPILSDGSSQYIGVVTLMTFVDNDKDGKNDLDQTKPVIPFVDLVPILQSADNFMMEVKPTVIPKGMASALIKADTGYQAGNVEVAAIAEFFGQSFTKFTLHGYSTIQLAAEPLITKILARSEFPYIVYFTDANGQAAYSIGEMTLSVSKNDVSAAEIGTSETTTEILQIDAGTIHKGQSATILYPKSLGKGSSTVTVEGAIKDLTFSTSTTITMDTQLPEKLGFFVPPLLLGNAKYTVPLQVLDKDGFPIKTVDEAEILVVPSVRNVISAPATIKFPQGEYYTTMLIEAMESGDTEITVLANQFQSTKLNVAVTTPQPIISLSSSSEIVRMNERFTVTLSSQYMNTPLSDLQVKWSSNLATLIEADKVTDEFGTATATFVMNHASPFSVSAEISGPGYEPTTVSKELQIESMLTQPVPLEEPINPGPADVLLNNSYIFILPAIGGVIFWLVKTERINLPINRLLEKFKKSED